MKNRLFNIIIFILLSAASTVLLAQGDIKKNINKNDVKIREKTAIKNKAVIKKEVVKKKEIIRKVETVKKAKDPEKVEKKKVRIDNRIIRKEDDSRGNTDSSLLSIDDGYYKYERIPEIIIKRKTIEIDTGVEETVQITEKIDFEEKNQTEGKGLFNISKDKTDTIAKVALVLFIFLIFVLYRIRAKSSGKNVLRNFPKK